MNQMPRVQESSGIVGEGKKPVPKMDIENFFGSENLSSSDKRQDQFREMFLKSILDPVKKYPPPESVINIIQNGESIPLLTLKSFSLWQGKQKSKKTTLLAIMIAAYINPKTSQETIRLECAVPGKVLFFDNEQGTTYAARTMKTILNLAGLENSENLIYCDLREYSPNDRFKIIEAGIDDTHDTRLVIIDGIVDLLTDFMSPSEGHMSITNIVRLCSIRNIHIAGVLHQNKTDKNVRAHVGTISSQKCEIEISTEVDTSDRSQSIVTCINSRGLPFLPFAIRWDKGSLPTIVQDYIKNEDKSEGKKFSNVKKAISEVFKPGLSLTESNATKNMLDRKVAGSDSTAKRYLKLAWEEYGFITKEPDGKYLLGPQVQTGSNETS